jgi:peptide deformylase
VSRREIVEAGHPVLRERAREVSAEELSSPEIQGLIDDMIETMRAANGAGLAANQVAETVRVAVVEVQAAGAAHRDREPGDRAGGRRRRTDQRGLPVGAEPAR